MFFADSQNYSNGSVVSPKEETRIYIKSVPKELQFLNYAIAINEGYSFFSAPSTYDMK